MNNVEVVKTLDEYYGKGLNETQLRIYLKTLADIPADLLNMAAEHLIKTGKPFMPRVSEIRQAASEITRLGQYEKVDPLKLIPGAAQTEADLDERYGTKEEHRAICDVFTSGGELPDSQCAVLQVD